VDYVDTECEPEEKENKRGLKLSITLSKIHPHILHSIFLIIPSLVDYTEPVKVIYL
jgi:hypothetical protein